MTRFVSLSTGILFFIIIKFSEGLTSFGTQPQTNQAERFDHFDWRLAKIIGSSVNDNVVLSPISIKLVLGMLYEGAKGNSSRQLEDALNLTRDARMTTTSKFSTILQSLEAPSNAYDLDIGTKLFIDKNADLIPEYENTISMKYNASIQKLDFMKTKEAVREINKWAMSVTKGHIKDLVNEADAQESTVLLLLNAVYFKGTWVNQFLNNETKTDYFYTPENNAVTAEFMNGVHYVQYAESEELNCSILRLPYLGYKFSMFIILPDHYNGLDHVIKTLTPDILRTILPKMLYTQVNISLPKFKFDYASSLRPVLQELGIADIFTIRADLTGIAKAPKQHLMVSNVIQKAGIEINEKGSTAFAATEVDLASKFGERPVLFKANKSFIFYIEDEATDTIVFLGKVVNPGSDGIDKVDSKIPIEPPVYLPFPAPQPGKEFIPQGGYYNAEGQYVRQYFDQSRLSIFDIQMVETLGKSKPTNWVISTASIKTVLSMLYEGSAERTESQLANVLRLPYDKNSGLRQIHAVQSELHSPTGQSVSWKMANRLLVSNKLPIGSDFREAVIRKFRAKVDNFNFASPQGTAYEINSWVNDSTNGLIPQLVDAGSIDPKSQLVLLNAVYFKSDWDSAFDEKLTVMDCFYVKPGQCKKVPTMRQQGLFKYGLHKVLYAHILELPYLDSRFSMVLVVPTMEGGLADILRNLPYAPILEFLNNLQSSEVALSLPRFTIDFSTELKEVISSLGANDLFSNSADLKNMLGPNRAKVDAFFHKAKIIVNEKGSEAGAGSAAAVVPLMINQLSYVNANQPFLFFIRDVKTGFLFAGQLVDPTLS